MPSLLVSAADRRRLAGAGSALFLVGSYDGSGNYGDVLQLAGAIRTAAGLPGRPFVVAIVEHGARAHHGTLAERFPAAFGEAAFAFYADDGVEPAAPLEPVEAGDLPDGAALHLYGGGYLNAWWGARKLAHVAALEGLAERPLPLAASGLQVEDEAVAPGGVGHDLLSRAAWVGLRDAGSLRLIRARIPSLDGRVELAGDDAMPLLAQAPVEAAPTVNLHFNDGAWVSEDPDALRDRILAVLRALGESSAARLDLRPVIAYEDPCVSEREMAANLLERHGEELEGLGFRLLQPLDILDDALGNRLGSFSRARLTVSCFYHVTLSSLLAGVPAALPAANEYYAQKAAGLRDLFQLGPDLIGDADPAAAALALDDGPPRAELVAHLRDRGRSLLSGFEPSRRTLAMTLAGELRRGALELQGERERRRADAAERELSAMRGTRGWRLLDRLRAVRGAFGSAAVPTPRAPDPPVDEQPTTREEIARLEGLVAEARGRSDHALEVARDMSLPTRLLAYMSWLELRPPAEDLRVSIVLATRNRPRLLARALRSAIDQRYANWQLLVVDDGADPGAVEAVRALDDPRLVLLRGAEHGAGAARNVGLESADGDVVCYLDDDNVLHPGWLAAVAHVFATRADVEVAYGVSVAEHRIAGELGEHGWWPSFWQLPWSRENLLRENVTDIGAMAHRRRLDGARFDEELASTEDWDLLLRLTADRDALAIPAISHACTMEGDDRMSRDPGHAAAIEAVRKRYSR